MGRHVRRVAVDWKHPEYADGSYEPLLEEQMPAWPEAEKTHLQMYEDCSEGTPISPPMPDADSLARWLADNKASAFADRTATYEQWRAMIGDGWAPSAVLTAGGGMVSGVEAATKKDGGDAA